MDLLQDDVKNLYRKFLIPSMGGAVVTSIYGFVDTIAVGHAIGPAGAAATAIILPLYGATAFVGILCGIGGAVLMSNAAGEGRTEKRNAYFTASLLLMAVLSALFLVGLNTFSKEIFTLFGADATLMPLVMDYAKWVILACPFFLFSMYLACIVRNDGAPGLVMMAVVTGGVFNVFGDWLFVFPMNMGMGGAALATAFGNVMQTAIMCSHFFSKKCTLRLVKPFKTTRAFCKIITTGFSAGILNIAFMVLTCLFNNQIMRYGGTTELAVFGVVITISALFQQLYGGIGQAVQPLISANYGAGNHARIRMVFRLAVATTAGCSVLFTSIGLFFPNTVVRLFINITPEVLEQAPAIIRINFLGFLFMGINIFATFFLQSVMKSTSSTMIAFLRGIAISTVLVFLLPLWMGADGIWWSVAATELLVLAITIPCLKDSLDRQLDQMAPLSPHA